MFRALIAMMTVRTYDERGALVDREPNWMAIIMVISCMIMVWGNVKTGFNFIWKYNSGRIFDSKVEKIEKQLKQKGLEDAKSAQELDDVLKKEYDSAFEHKYNNERQNNDALLHEIDSLKKIRSKYEQELKECGDYPASLDGHRD